MYFNVIDLLKDELAGIDTLLAGLQKTEEGTSRFGRRDSVTDLNGHMYVTSAKGNIVYHHRYLDRNGKRRSKKLGPADCKEVIDFKQKVFETELKKTLLANRAALEKVIKELAAGFKPYNPDSIDSRIGSVYRDHTGLVNKSPGIMSKEDWMRAPYSRNSFQLPARPHIACDGTPVRSKSEVILYNTLYHMGVSFRYEADIDLVNEAGQKVRLNADFLILLDDGRQIILEHLGMLSQDDYFEKAMQKFRIYALNGYVLGRDLFFTMDDIYGKIDTYAVQKMIRCIMS